MRSHHVPSLLRHWTDTSAGCKGLGGGSRRGGGGFWGEGERDSGRRRDCVLFLFF